MIPTSKWGDCTRCDKQDTACVKVGKNLICINCNNNKKRRVQILKAQERDKQHQSKSIAAHTKSKIRTLHSSEENREMSSRQSLIDDLDWVCSRITRLRYADKEGNVECFTCDKKLHWSLQQCGHFIPRTHMGVRFDKANLKVQCRDCNEFKGGNLEVYRQRLESERPGITDTLYELSKEVDKSGNDYLSQLLIAKREELKLIENSRK